MTGITVDTVMGGRGSSPQLVNVIAKSRRAQGRPRLREHRQAVAEKQSNTGFRMMKRAEDRFNNNECWFLACSAALRATGATAAQNFRTAAGEVHRWSTERARQFMASHGHELQKLTCQGPHQFLTVGDGVYLVRPPLGPIVVYA